ncbi:hypothetical protein G7Y31_01240 [Corynebacterium lizhenjunii]|uniref:Uncharacterized protein n=1 Tax=Corynebacterium lizhenjunii TaxID=2709394 RepID=A0A7T0KFJ3_9CORY|nr:hypothetical protein [Corynebacterium lizhenjunii]QPK79375.1 hypothetical protein G7Y31_01240 [Corynebacterium lizhenjunii]
MNFPVNFPVNIPANFPVNFEQLLVMINEFLGGFVHQGSSALAVGALNLGLM